MTKAMQQRVMRRARWRCEYCRKPRRVDALPFQIDHIVARQHGGRTMLQNLALACAYCNAHKGPNIAGVDPETGEVERLYNPREDRWTDHFQWSGPRLVGRTALGRATISVLGINHLTNLATRAQLMAEGAYERQ